MKDKIVLTDCFELFSEVFTPKILLDVNTSRIMLVKINGDNIPWHCHENEEELFWVISGSIVIWTREGSIALSSGELYKIPKGVEHRVTSTEPAQIVLFESNTFLHTGSTKSDITKHTFDYLLYENVNTNSATNEKCDE